ncbi:MAG: metalloprotease family protein [Chthoniobacter sp.]|uniref:metalloprotease family protein n=1 Tax=Chthoniobacter sp. TaxID=2510640 RepID=UPI0032A78936
MFFIPGFLISILTCPGVIVHELAHVMFCKLTGTAIHKVCYFRIGNPSGYVIHDRPTSVWKHILIGVGPFFLNTFIGVACGLVAALAQREFR